MGKKIKKSCGDDHVDLSLLLSEDVLINILVCQPVKSLLRFKSVCKYWRQLIQSSFFIDLHTTFNSSSSSSKFGAFVLQTKEPSHDNENESDDIKLYMLSCDGDGDDQERVYKADDLGFLPFYKDYQLTHTLRMVGSCNGIICLHDPALLAADKGYKRHNYSHLRDVSLWNPATRHFRILPKSITIEETKYGGCDFVAFGFDVKTKDYKVLRITPWDHRIKSEEGGFMCRVQVYSLSTDSWRLLEGIDSLPVIPTHDLFLNHGIYLNGSYFVVLTKRNDWMMLSFDFTKEIFTTMELPDINISTKRNLVLSYLGEKLVVFIKTSPIDIWVLNEQHDSGGCVNKESWTKLQYICMEEVEAYDLPLICISNNGEMELFNLVTKEAKKDFLISGTTPYRVDVYQESLVSIMGGGNVLLRWQLPTHGTTYKLNLDAPFVSYRPFGIGLCLTSDTGGCIGVRSLQRDVRDAAKGEAVAIIEAIKWAIELKLSPIIIESDYKSSRARSLLKKAKLLLNSSSELGRISFQYCSTSCNYVADIAAKLLSLEHVLHMGDLWRFFKENLEDLNSNLSRIGLIFNGEQ